MFDYQVTIYNPENKYRPISTIVRTDVEINLGDKQQRKSIQDKGVQKICLKKYWTRRELTMYNYSRVKCRKIENNA